MIQYEYCDITVNFFVKQTPLPQLCFKQVFPIYHNYVNDGLALESSLLKTKHERQCI